MQSKAAEESGGYQRTRRIKIPNTRIKTNWWRAYYKRRERGRGGERRKTWKQYQHDPDKE